MPSAGKILILFLSFEILIVPVFAETHARGQEIIELRCKKCHPAHYYEDKGHIWLVWEIVIMRMQFMHGARLDEGERNEISSYLANARQASTAQVALEASLLILPIAVMSALLWRHYRKRR